MVPAVAPADLYSKKVTKCNFEHNKSTHVSHAATKLGRVNCDTFLEQSLAAPVPKKAKTVIDGDYHNSRLKNYISFKVS